MVFDKLVLILLAHAFQRIEFTFEVSFESVTCLNDLVHDIESLLLADTWAEWETGEVSSYSNSCGVDHGLLLWSKICVLKTISRHIWDVLGAWSVIVVVFYYLIKQFVEFGIGIVGASIYTNSRVLVRNSGENAHLKWNSFLAALVFVLIPNFSG